jgi:uncharacterized repeat protein (TIGR01451 family)
MRIFRHLSFPTDLVCALSLLGLGGVLGAQTPIVDATASYASSQGSSYTEAGSTYNFGVEPAGEVGNDLIVTSFDVDLGLGDGLQQFTITSFADRIHIVRQDNATISGNKQLLFFEDSGSGGSTFNLRPALLNTMEAALLNEVINRGTDNVFGNANGVNTNNIERIDFIVDAGIPVPADTQGDGFVVLERGGNDAFKMAAITGLDGSGEPNAFGPVLSVEIDDWGATQLGFPTDVLASASPAANLTQTASVSDQAVSGLYVSFDELGAVEGDVIYGYALAGGDVSTDPADWLDTGDPGNFPRNTSAASNDAGGLDLLAGGSISSRSPRADLALSKVVSDATPLVGDNVTFTVTIVNNGPFSTIGTQVSDSLPTGYSFISSNPSRGSYAAGSGVWTIGGMTAGESQSLEIVAQVEPSGSYLNVATVNDLSDPDNSNNTASAGVTPSFPASDLSITKVSNAGGPVNHGDIVTYTIEVENTGGSTVGGVDVEDLLPAGMSYVPGSVSAALDPVPPAGGTFVETRSNPGPGTFTVPAGVTELTGEAWGGGGGGAAANNDHGGGAGGGGAYARLENLTVTPGADIDYTVGAGGSAPGAGNPGVAGSASTFFNPSTLLAAGGGGGGSPDVDSPGIGGAASASVGDVRFSGGNGGSGRRGGGSSSTRAGGGGGASAFASGAGNNGGDGQTNDPGDGGIGQGEGGSGGNGGQAGVIAGQPGEVPGGGGGGCGGSGAGAGAGGQIVITYTVPSLEGVTGAPPNLASGWTLEPGATLTITFAATLDADAVTSELTNTALFTSDDDPLPVGASVSDPVNRATLGDFVWRDLNGNGLQDAGEPGLAGVTVALLDANGDAVTAPSGSPITTVTDGAGSYTIDGLPPGDYQLEFALPGAFIFTGQDVDGLGSDGPLNSDADPATGRTPTINVTTGENSANIAAGAFVLASISGRVQVDQTGDGLADQPQAGVVLTLLDASGSPVLDAANDPVTATTDSSGNYIFNGLAPGNYQVRQTAPAGFAAISDTDGGDLAVIGDVTPLTVTSGGPLFSRNFINSQFAALTAPEFCLSLGTNLGGDFVRPTGLPANIAYRIEYAAALGDPTVWAGAVELTAANTTASDNGDGTETVAVGEIPSLTGLGDASGFVRLVVNLDGDSDGTIDATVYSAVFGWLESEFGVECRSYSNPFLSCASLRATVTAASGSALTLDADVPPLGSGVSSYLEIVNGVLEGQRFDIAAASGNTVTLANAVELCSGQAPFNTVTGAPGSGVIGAAVVIREHATLDTRFPVQSFEAANDPTVADQITVRDGDSVRCYWLYDDNGVSRWVLTGDSNLDDRGAVVLPPGHGVWVTSRSSKALLAYGQVRANDFVRPLCQGLNAVSGGYPITQSAVEREYSLASGFTGHPDFVQADQFLIWNGDNISGRQGYQAFYLSDFYSPERWIKTADVFRSDVKTQPLFIRDRAVFLDLKQDLPAYRNPVPWSTQP